MLDSARPQNPLQYFGEQNSPPQIQTLLHTLIQNEMDRMSSNLLQLQDEHDEHQLQTPWLQDSS